jgi:sporulation protein YlmC with PRC-barrel domain
VSETTEFTIGAAVSCTDGECGEIKSVVIDPVARAVTHLVIEPEHRLGLGRLVPLDLLDTAAGEIHLRGTLAEFDELPAAEETHFVPGTPPSLLGYGPGQAYLWPYYGLGNATVPVVQETLPVGQVSVHRDDPVHAADGDIGRVQGLVIDPRTHHVTHILLQEGHLWGRKEVSIPITAVTSVENGIRLNLSKQEIEDLPPVDIDRAGD